MIKVTEYSVTSEFTEYSDDRLLSPQSIDLRNVHTNKVEQASLFVSCIGPVRSEHALYFWG